MVLLRTLPATCYYRAVLQDPDVVLAENAVILQLRCKSTCPTPREKVHRWRVRNPVQQRKWRTFNSGSSRTWTPYRRDSEKMTLVRAMLFHVGVKLWMGSAPIPTGPGRRLAMTRRRMGQSGPCRRGALTPWMRLHRAAVLTTRVQAYRLSTGPELHLP